MDPRTFAVERLNVGDWPRTDGLANVAITPEAWAACADSDSKIAGEVCFAFDVPPDRSSACIAVAGWRQDGRAHVEIVKYARKTDWVAAELAELVVKHRPVGVICDATGPAASVLSEIKETVDLMQVRERDVTLVSTREHAQGCGIIFDAVADRALRHLDEAPLARAIMGSIKRSSGDAWLWSRKDSTVDICPLVAVTLALWGAQTIRQGEPTLIDLNDFV